MASALQKKVTEAAYLTAANHERYRPIMRFFYRGHMAHQYAFTLEEVHGHVAPMVPGYTSDQCEQDLGQLCEWGNLTAEQDRSRARTVEEFLRRSLRYSITPYGVAFERLLSELEESGGTGGSLDPSLLELLSDALQRLEAAVGEAARYLPGPEGEGATSPAAQARVAGRAPLPSGAQAALRGVYNLWNQVFDTFHRIGRQASDYLAELHRGQEEDLADVEVFLAYKEVLLQYLNSFVSALFDHGDRLAAFLRRVTGSSGPRWPDLPVALLVAYETRYVPSPTGVLPEAAAVAARRQGEWSALVRWFRASGGLETLRRRTTGAIEQVVRQSQRLMDRRAGLSRRRELEALACAFARTPSLAAAHRLAALAFGCAAPRHVLGSAEVFSLQPGGPVWEQRPQEIALEPIRRGGGGRRGRGGPAVTVDEERQRQALAAELERRRREAALWDRLFQGDELSLGEASLAEPALRARLLDVLGRCLASPDRTAVAPDGSLVRLTLPEAGAPPGALRAPDGTFYLPRFRLVRQRVTLRRPLEVRR